MFAWQVGVRDSSCLNKLSNMRPQRVCFFTLYLFSLVFNLISVNVFKKYSEYESGINLQMLKSPAPESKHPLK